MAKSGAGAISPDSPEVKEVMESVRERVDQLVSSNGKRSSRSYHKELGQIMWEYAGMARNEKGLNKAIGQIQDLRDDFNKNLLVPGSGDNLNAELERAGRVRDFLDFGELLCRDALLKERNLVVVTFVRNIKLKMVKHFVTMKTLHMPPYGSTREMGKLQVVTRKS